MKLGTVKTLTTLATVALAGGLWLSPVLAQANGQGAAPANGQQGGGQGRGRGPQIDPAEEAGVKAFNAATDPDAKIQAGKDFEQKFPNSRYQEAVSSTMVTLYYQKQDWADFYDEAHKTLTKDPDNVPVLTVVGWVIPRAYNPSDPSEAAKLDESEKDEKHALELLAALPKPAGLSDEQFNEAKASDASEAHSGLGMTYFRKNDFANSAKELEASTGESSDVDPSDLYVLGVDYQKLSRNTDAAAAFTKCADIPGSLQDKCKQSAASLAGSSLTPSK
jgi:tetratricopeptide (TPR) repeat protein